MRFFFFPAFPLFFPPPDKFMTASPISLFFHQGESLTPSQSTPTPPIFFPFSPLEELCLPLTRANGNLLHSHVRNSLVAIHPSSRPRFPPCPPRAMRFLRLSLDCCSFSTAHPPPCECNYDSVLFESLSSLVFFFFFGMASYRALAPFSLAVDEIFTLLPPFFIGFFLFC